MQLLSESMTRQINDLANSLPWKKFLKKVIRLNATMKHDVRNAGIHPRRTNSKSLTKAANAIE